MANNIERLNYYEREYLRSFDFIAEQDYHIEMRRRLNLGLHPWGIVEGLDVKQSEPTPGLPPQFYISPGMAIDAYGREIVLFAPYTLGEEDLNNSSNRVDQEKPYSLWIAYDRTLTTPPSAGFAICDDGDQYTRWHESFKILIRDANYKNTTEPTSFSSLSDDPTVEWLVRLGTITTKIIDGELTIEQARPEQRVYIGVRAQRLIAPVASLVSTDPSVPSPADAALPITVEADLQEKKNLIVGDNFDIDGTKVLPLPADPPKFPGPVGNIKAANAFLRDNLYLNVAPNWVGLKEYIQRLIPDIRTGSKDLSITPGADPSTNVEIITLTSTLPAVRPPSMVAFVAQVDRLTASQYITWLSNINPNSPFVFDVVVGVPIQKTANTYDFPIRWTIGPTANPNTANALLNVTAVTISYVAIFYPL